MQHYGILGTVYFILTLGPSGIPQTILIVSVMNKRFHAAIAAFG